eukprot:CAMPEP_0118939040 /NCGR_PEP_ID=MMETSP1169-20130426/27800_1 /TAXON_ID=36882 /ORGANISM="Pyramimonas obovata, Strain CCMP722" /LENGTH=198 /DNA_ID=CAMNT_0006883209 /DNA_START=173 /DNA_END=767 /DNA_ORIENTATION=-
MAKKKKFDMSTGYVGDKGALAQNEALSALRDKLKASTQEPPKTSVDNTKANKPQGQSKGNEKKGAGAAPAQQFVRVQATRRGRGGKTVTIISGVEAEEAEKKKLSKKLKARCGAGGKVDEDGNIEIQGDHASSLVDILVSMGYTGAKKSGGGKEGLRNRPSTEFVKHGIKALSGGFDVLAAPRTCFNELNMVFVYVTF